VLSEYIAINLILIVSFLLLLPSMNPFHTHWRMLVLLPISFVQFKYINWRYESTLASFQWDAMTLWLFYTEALVVLYVMWQCITLLRHRDRTSNCNVIPCTLNNVIQSVDLFIPTHSESEALLLTTIRAAKLDNHPDLTIWICDDGARDWLRDLCKHENINYLRRPANHLPKNKAGNLNWSISHGTADYIICLDADFQALPTMSSQLLRLFSDPEIGLVQAPQHFRNLDPVQLNLIGGSAWTEEQRFFFDISLPARDAWDNALCVGSCWATRREILEDLQGFPTDSIVEDVYFGYRVKSLGWQTAYLNEKVAVGLAAVDAPSYISQRSRWCMGAMALLSAPHGPLKARDLTLKDRFFYFDICLYWVSHLNLLLLLIAPILYGFFGFVVFDCTTEELMLILIPKNIIVSAAFYWISQGRCMPIITQVQKTLPIFWVTLAMFRGLLFPKALSFDVTKKAYSSSEKRTIHWNIALPFTLIGVLNVFAMVLTHSQSFSQLYWSDYTFFNTLLSAYSLITIFLCCLICVDKSGNHKHNNADDIPLTGSLLKTSKALTKRTFK